VDGVADFVLVTGPGTPRVTVLSRLGGEILVPPIDPFGGNFTGGVYPAAVAEFGMRTL
jgi:hypothetical protein